ncbi:MAG: hypothetical protein ACLUIQ_11595 [Dialister invisus]
MPEDLAVMDIALSMILTPSTLGRLGTLAGRSWAPMLAALHKTLPGPAL